MGEYIRKTFPVRGMDCSSCVRIIETELKKLEGVEDARINFLMRKVIVTYEPEKVGIPDIEKNIEKLGYRLSYKKYEGILSRISKTLKRSKEEEDLFRLVHDHEFEDMVLKSNKPVVLMFSNSDCVSCSILKMRFMKMIEKYKEQIYFYQMNIKTSNKWQDYAIKTTPTLLIFKEKQIVERWDSLPDTHEVENKIKGIFSIFLA